MAHFKLESNRAIIPVAQDVRHFIDAVLLSNARTEWDGEAQKALAGVFGFEIEIARLEQVVNRKLADYP